MGEQKFNLEEYLTRGVEKIVGGIIRSTLKNGETSRFMIHYSKAAGAAVRKRHEHEMKGRTYTCLSDCQHSKRLQPSLCGMLCQSGGHVL